MAGLNMPKNWILLSLRTLRVENLKMVRLFLQNRLDY
jgi:hypothetical protein